MTAYSCFIFFEPIKLSHQNQIKFKRFIFIETDAVKVGNRRHTFHAKNNLRIKTIEVDWRYRNFITFALPIITRIGSSVG